MQPDAADKTVLFVDDMIFMEIYRHLGVDIDHARGSAIWDALEDVQQVLAARWADGGTLATIAKANRYEAEDIILNVAPSAGAVKALTDRHDPLRRT